MRDEVVNDNSPNQDVSDRFTGLLRWIDENREEDLVWLLETMKWEIEQMLKLLPRRFDDVYF